MKLYEMIINFAFESNNFKINHVAYHIYYKRFIVVGILAYLINVPFDKAAM